MRPRRRRGRGWLVRRVLLLADLVGLVAAFGVTQLVLPGVSNGFNPDVTELFVFFLLSLPVWAIAAKLYGLYDRDEERTDHSTPPSVERMIVPS